MGQALRSAPAGHTAAFSYEWRRPEETTLYQVVQEQFEIFLAQVEAKTGTGLPEFVKDEFEAYLECGILAHGFLRVRCADCAHEKRVAFSCKRRGFCPSCGARRMAGSAAYLVDQVIPRVPVRQWVLSFPIPLRILFAAHPELLAPVLRIVHRVIARFLLKQAGLKRCAADTGAVTLIQRFGSAANLNVHLHGLVATAAGFTIWGLQPGARADLLVVETADASLLGLPDEHLLDALVFSSPSRPWRDVMVSGRWVVRNHRHDVDAAQAFRAAMLALADFS